MPYEQPPLLHFRRMRMVNGNGSGIGHWVRNEPICAVAFMLICAAVFVLAAWLLALIGTSAYARINNARNPMPTVTISGEEAELHMLNGLLEHLKSQHGQALQASRRSDNAQIRAQQARVASDMEAFMREVVEAINARSGAGHDENKN